MGNRVWLFPYALCQTCLARGVGVGKQQQQIGGNGYICVYMWGWNNTLRLSSDHTDSLPTPAVPPDIYILQPNSFTLKRCGGPAAHSPQ